MTTPAPERPLTRIEQITLTTAAGDLAQMPLEARDFPPGLQDHQPVRSGAITNSQLAKYGFADLTEAQVKETGRQGGYFKEFAAGAEHSLHDGLDLMATTTVHLFNNPEAVSFWIDRHFLRQFLDSAGNNIGPGAQLVSVDRLTPRACAGEAAALKAVQGGPQGIFSATIVNFKLGRLLGVACVGALGDYNRLELADAMAKTLEQRIVRCLLN